MNNLESFIFENFDRNFAGSERYLVVEDFIDFFFKETMKDKGKANRQKRIFSDSKVIQIEILQSSKKLKSIFNYLISVIENFSGNSIHIHINIELEESELYSLKLAFAFYTYKLGFKDLHLIEEELLKLDAEPKISEYPDCNGRVLNKLEKKYNGKRHQKRYLEFLRCLNNYSSSSSSPNEFLLNINRLDGDDNFISEYSKMPQSYDYFPNFGKRIGDLFEVRSDKHLEQPQFFVNSTTVINLFPVLFGPNVWYDTFIFDSLERWNETVGCNFRKIVTVTAKHDTFENLLKIKKANKFNVEELYVIFPFEIL